MEIKQILIVLLILAILYYLFSTTVEGYDVQITTSNGVTETLYDTSYVDLFFGSDTTTDGSSNITIPTNYFSDNGNKCVLSNNTIIVTTAQGAVTNYVSSSTSSTNITDQVFYDNNGGYAKIFSDGIHYFVEVQPYNAPLFVLTSNPPVATAVAAPAASPYMQGGIPYSMIPPGSEDLYILKSEIVPPVCPKCPDYSALPTSNTKCPPCPACARCPEPSFECKKVPNYQTVDPNSLPSPILNDFSTFGL